MRTGFRVLAALMLSGWAIAALAQDEAPRERRSAQTGPIKSDRYRVTFVRLGSDRMDGFVYEPTTPGPKAHIAVVYAFPAPNFTFSVAPELASRGYRVMLVRHYGVDLGPTDGFAETSKGIAYMRTVLGVDRVLVLGHSGGGRMMSSYANISANGPAACQRPEVIYPCKTADVAGLAKPDGVILLDPDMGGSEYMASIDPAFDDNGKRTRTDLDMFSPANGYDPKTGSAHYSPAFLKRFYAAQSARNNKIVDQALARLKLVESGQGSFSDDEPFVVPGASSVRPGGARIDHIDLSIHHHTKKPHLLLKADGTDQETVIQSVRPPEGDLDSKLVGTMGRGGAIVTTVRGYLANYAVRTGRDFAITEDDVIGVDWRTTNRQSVMSAEGITVPTLVVSMTCNHLVAPDEIIFDHLAAKDKTYAAVEGAVHTFTACKPEYGDTRKRLFDYVDSWLSKPGRFLSSPN